MEKNFIACIGVLLILVSIQAHGFSQEEEIPSQAFYFDWISSQYEGSTESQTLAKLSFFKWLHDEYGMILIRLDESIGLKSKEDVELRRFHPSERIIGRFKVGEEVAVEVLPFRSCLLMAASEPCDELGVMG
jgi:hypothetical protein